jgi:hypothetical protein
MKNPYDKQIGGSHYQKFKIQPSKFVIENELLYPEGCVIKYILRHRLKGKREDLKKAIHFIEMIIDGEIFRTPLGGFINCDENANCIKVEMGTEGSITDKWNLVTLRNITSGEELTLKYTFYNIKKDFLEEAQKEQKELDESYNEAVRQTKERTK